MGPIFASCLLKGLYHQPGVAALQLSFPPFRFTPIALLRHLSKTLNGTECRKEKAINLSQAFIYPPLHPNKRKGNLGMCFKSLKPTDQWDLNRNNPMSLGGSLWGNLVSHALPKSILSSEAELFARTQLPGISKISMVNLIQQNWKHSPTNWAQKRRTFRFISQGEQSASVEPCSLIYQWGSEIQGMHVPGRARSKQE